MMDLTSFPEEGRVSVEVAAQVPGQQSGLDMKQKADGHFFAEKRMSNLLRLSLLIGLDDSPTRIIIHCHGPGNRHVKAVRTNLAPVYQGQCDPVGQGGT